MRSPPPADSRATGFTLVEILVALAIAGIVGLIIMQGVGLATHGLGRLSDRVDRLDQRRGIEMQLRRILGSAAAIPVFDGAPAFIGRRTDLSFLSLAEDGGPGLYRFELAFEANRPDRPLILLRQLADTDVPPRVQEGVLARQVRAFSLAYFGSPSLADKPAWHQSWEGLIEPPRLIRMLLDDGDGVAHPPVILRIGNGG